MAKTTEEYQVLSQRLDEVVAAIQAPDVSIDQALALYEEGAELITKIRNHLKTAENRITKLQAKTET